jgi:hypothetical protein
VEQTATPPLKYFPPPPTFPPKSGLGVRIKVKIGMRIVRTRHNTRYLHNLKQED